jgi:hypothetical protein
MNPPVRYDDDRADSSSSSTSSSPCICIHGRSKKHVQKVTISKSILLKLLTYSHTNGRFQPSTDISGQTSVKTSVQRSIRSSILSQWKIDPETFDQIWPKKEPITLVKWSASNELACGVIRSSILIVNVLWAAENTFLSTNYTASLSSFSITMVRSTLL